ISAGAVSQSQDVCFYCNYYAGYWKFDETSGTTSGDSSGNGNDGRYDGGIFNDGIIMNGAPFTTGKYGHGLNFNAINYFVEVPDSNVLSPSQFTLSAWIKWDGARYTDDRTFAAIISKGYYGGGEYTILMARDSANTKTNINFYVGGQLLTWENSDINTNWHLITATFNDTNATIYFDGIPKNSTILPIAVSTDYAMRIGHETTTFSYPWGGAIDEVRIYNRALSQQEIQEDMNSAQPVNTGLVASYSFEEGSGAIAHDTHHHVAGKYDSAVGFDGLNGFVNVSSSNIGSANQMTIELWTKPGIQIGSGGPNPDHKDIIRANCLGGPQNGLWGISTSGEFNINNQIGFVDGWITGSDTWFLPSNAVATKNEWNHLVLILNRDDGKVKFYRNGELIGETTEIVGVKPETTRFGIAKNCVGPFNGIIDEVKILNIARSMTTS
ncbi:MAG: LamG domain-containing protein, partial [Candidatus Aenigmatarchaeota archaeon]